MSDGQSQPAAALDIGSGPGALAVFGFATVFLLALAPEAPLARELAACEVGAVKDVLAGHVVLPRFEPGVYVHVPPLYWWVAAGLIKVMGMSELALRAPALLAAAATCAVLYWWLARAWSPRAGLLGAAALLFGQFFADAARQPRMDSMLTLFVSAATVLLETTISERAGRLRLSHAAAALLIFLAVLSKGPLGILLPALTIALVLLVQRRFKELLSPALLACFSVSLIASMTWYVAAYLVGGAEFFRWQVETGLLKRFVPTEIGGAGFCKHPFYYFIPHLVTGFVPWSLFIPAALVFGYSKLKAGGRGETPRRRQALVFAGVWFAAIFGFFSFSTGKCLVYILPAFVPLSALIGMTLDHLLDEDDAVPSSALLARIAVCLVGVAAAFTLLTFIAIGANGALSIRTLGLHLHRSDRAFLLLLESLAQTAQAEFLIFCALSGLACVSIAGGLWRGVFLPQVLGVVLFAAAGVLFWYGALSPMRAAQTSLRDFAKQIDQLLPAGASVTYIGPLDCEVAFVYSTRSIGYVNEPDSAPKPPPGYLIYRQDQFSALAPAIQQQFRILARSAAVDSHGGRLLVIREPQSGVQLKPHSAQAGLT